jgi:hypothetical protein
MSTAEQRQEASTSVSAVPPIDRQANTRCHVLGHHWHDERVGFSTLRLTACTRCGEVPD